MPPRLEPMQMGAAIMKTKIAISRKTTHELKLQLTSFLPTLHLNYVPAECKATCAQTLFLIANDWKELKHPNTVHWLNEL